MEVQYIHTPDQALEFLINYTKTEQLADSDRLDTTEINEMFASSEMSTFTKKRLNMRQRVRDLCLLTYDWSVEQCFDFFTYLKRTSQIKELHFAGLIFLVYHYPQIKQDTENILHYESIIIDGYLDTNKQIETLAEYCLHPLVNFSKEWKDTVFQWSQRDHEGLWRAAVTSFKRCAADKDTYQKVFQLCENILTQKPSHSMMKCMAQLLRRVGKRQKVALKSFLTKFKQSFQKAELRVAASRLHRRDINELMEVIESKGSLLDKDAFLSSLQK